MPWGFTPELKQWMHDKNADMLFHFSEKSYEVLTLEMRDGFGGQPSDWNTIVPAGVFPILAKLEALNMEPGPGIASGCGYRDGRSHVHVFRTRAGLAGYYQLRGLDDLDDLDGRGVEISYKLVLEQPESQTPNPKSAGSAVSQTPPFGPVIERTMNLFDPENQTVAEDAFIDFKTDRVATTPEAVLQEARKQLDEGLKPHAVWDWVRQEKLDAQAQLLYDHPVVIGVEFYGADMIVRQIPNAQWDAMKPSEASSELEKWSEEEVRYPSMKAVGFPTTYAFRTQEGEIGLLQIVSYNAEKKTARIRYKVAPGGKAPTATAGPLEDSPGGTQCGFHTDPGSPHGASQSRSEYPDPPSDGRNLRLTRRPNRRTSASAAGAGAPCCRRWKPAVPARQPLASPAPKSEPSPPSH
jgi:hypothetical protein